MDNESDRHVGLLYAPVRKSDNGGGRILFGRRVWPLARFLLMFGRMKKASDRKGSVLMEYLLVLVFIGATLMVASTRLFYSHVPKGTTGSYRENPPGFGTMGLQFVHFYQRTMGGLALPIP